MQPGDLAPVPPPAHVIELALPLPPPRAGRPALGVPALAEVPVLPTQPLLVRLLLAVRPLRVDAPPERPLGHHPLVLPEAPPFERRPEGARLLLLLREDPVDEPHPAVVGVAAIPFQLGFWVQLLPIEMDEPPPGDAAGREHEAVHALAPHEDLCAARAEAVAEVNAHHEPPRARADAEALYHLGVVDVGLHEADGDGGGVLVGGVHVAQVHGVAVLAVLVRHDDRPDHAGHAWDARNEIGEQHGEVPLPRAQVKDRHLLPWLQRRPRPRALLDVLVQLPDRH
mmetsp:Transcript_70481/g.223285  ORF Transcript_70481/g.223285 Transcript_70481/m.223285 type:complete len:283 (-) Transcript_70481:258-1106(-)